MTRSDPRRNRSVKRQDQRRLDFICDQQGSRGIQQHLEVGFSNFIIADWIFCVFVKVYCNHKNKCRIFFLDTTLKLIVDWNLFFFFLNVPIVLLFLSKPHFVCFFVFSLQICMGKTATEIERRKIFQEVISQARTLMTDVFGNYIIQKFLEFRDVRL